MKSALLCFLVIGSCWVPSAFAKVDLRDDVHAIEDGSYLLLEKPILIHQGTTAVMMGRMHGGRAMSRLGGPSCEIDLVKASGVDIFKRNLVLKTGTKLFVQQNNAQLAFVDESQKIRLPLVCREPDVKSKKAKVANVKFTIHDLASVFSRIGTLYLMDSRKTAKN